MCIENRHTCLSFNGEHTNLRIIASSALKIMTRKMMTEIRVLLHLMYTFIVGFLFQSGPTGSHSLPVPAGSRTGDPRLGEGPPRDVPGGEAETVRAVQASVRGAWVRYNPNSNIVIILTG